MFLGRKTRRRKYSFLSDFSYAHLFGIPYITVLRFPLSDRKSTGVMERLKKETLRRVFPFLEVHKRGSVVETLP